MKLEDVQSFAASQITAVPELAAFGAPIEFDPSMDEVELRELIATRLRIAGVCIEIVEDEVSRTSDSATSRGITADVLFNVFVSENPKLPHTPTGKALRKSVIDAVVKFIPQETRAEFLKSETAVNEHGYVLYAISFTIRVTIP